MSDQVKFLLNEEDLPRSWYNIISDLPENPGSVLHPGTGQPIGPDDLAPLFPMASIMQEVSGERAIDIPEPVRDIYRQWRPSPLYRARRLEKALDTPARIYYKYEGVSPTGSHKPNTAIAQAFFCKEEGKSASRRETGAGQWDHHWLSRDPYLGWRSRCSWSVSAMTKNPIVVPLWKLSAQRVTRAQVTDPESDEKFLPRILTTPEASGSRSVKLSKSRPSAMTPNILSVVCLIMCPCIKRWVGQEAMRQMELAERLPRHCDRLYRRRQ